MRWGSWWAFQWSWDGWLSLGIHLDFRARVESGTGVRYGPYVDFHVGWCILSLGVNPIYSGDLDLASSVARGGKRAC